MRASLRGSRKLQALQDNHPLAIEQRPPAGIDNDAFIADEDVERILGKWQYRESVKSKIHSSKVTFNASTRTVAAFKNKSHFY